MREHAQEESSRSGICDSYWAGMKMSMADLRAVSALLLAAVLGAGGKAGVAAAGANELDVAIM